MKSNYVLKKFTNKKCTCGASAGKVGTRVRAPDFFTKEKAGAKSPFVPTTWWAIKDSNLGPSGYEPDALTN